MGHAASNLSVSGSLTRLARILYVDDEVNLCRSMERMFGRHRTIQLETFTSPKAALTRLGECGFDVVISDLRMPEMDGIEFLTNVRRSRPEARRLLVSGFADFETAQAAINNVGIDRLLTKPWNNDELIRAVQAAAEHVTLLRENARIQQELRDAAAELGRINRSLDAEIDTRTKNLFEGLIAALDMRDSETKWHSRRVGLYARRLATEMGITGKELDDIERGSILHDIGKIGVRDFVLQKPGPLDESEWAEMKRHPTLGFEILKDMSFLAEARLIPLHHQERWDGSGYPAGLEGEKIAIGARIFSVVDTLDAITSNRPYRKARGYDIARAEIERCNETQFDPKVVAAFLRVQPTEWSDIRKALEQQGADD